jgi:hypothetical protein
MTPNNSQPLVIQILGFSRAGKDFTAAQLKLYYESIGKSVEIMSYAAPMKQIAATLFDISLEQLDYFKNNSDSISIEVVDYSGYTDFHSERVELDTNFRTFLQRMGNEAIKPIFGDAVWANLMQSAISKSSADIIIIPDCRFTVELEAIGGTTIRVINSSLPAPMQHASELELADFATDFVLDNTNYQTTPANIAELATRVCPMDLITQS